MLSGGTFERFLAIFGKKNMALIVQKFREIFFVKIRILRLKKLFFSASTLVHLIYSRKKNTKTTLVWTRLPPRQQKMFLTAKNSITDIPLQTIGKIKFEQKAGIVNAKLKQSIIVKLLICKESDFMN